MAGALVDSANVRGEISGRHPHRQSPQRSRRHGPQERIRPPGSVALATTGRSVCRSSFCGGERCCRCCCPPLPVFSCVGRLGTLAAAASPQTKPPAGAVAAPWLPSNTRQRPQTRQRRHDSPETLAEAVAAVRVLAGLRPSALSPSVSHTEVDPKRYPDNLCRPPLVWFNFFNI